MKVFKFGFSIFKKYLWQGIFYLAVLMLSVVLSMMLVQISRYVLDFVLNPVADSKEGLISSFLSSGKIGEVGSVELLLWLVGIFAGIVVVKAILQYFGGLVSQNYGNKYAQDLRNIALDKMLQRNSFSSLGDIFTMLTYDVYFIKELYQSLFPQLISFVFYSIIALVMLFLTHWILGLAMLACVPVCVFLAVRYVRSTNPYFILSRRHARKISTEIGEAAAGIYDIKTNGYEENEIEILKMRNEQYNNVKKECTNKSNKYQFFIKFIRAIFYAIVIAVAGWLAIVGQITIGAFSVAVSYGIAMLDNIYNSIYKIYQIQEALAYGENYREYVQKRNKIANNKTKEIVWGDINLSATKMSCEGIDGHNLLSFNFSIPQNSKVGFWFKEDKGCHALSEVLLRQIEPSNGGLSLNKTDYKEINIDSLRRQFSYLAPSSYLFNKTIKDNIILFENIDEQRYQNILSLVGLKAYNDKMPKGDMEIIESKNQGYPALQRQMIGLCRAMYQTSKILVIEKPLQALCESKTSQIISNIIDYEEERTVIIISPSLEIMKRCETIYVVENSKIVGVYTYGQIVEKFK